MKRSATIHNVLKLLTLSLIVLGNGFEGLPLFHHHEEEHACAQRDGSFYYLEYQTGRSEDRENDALVGVRLGETHDHELCALCELVPRFDYHVLSKPHFEETLCVFSQEVLFSLAHANFDTQNARGPPRTSFI